MMTRRGAAASPAAGALPIVLGAAAVGAAGYLLLRPRAAAASTALPPATLPPLPPITGGAPLPVPPVASGSPGQTYGINGPDPSPAVVARLRASAQAREVFALQALAYSYGYTQAVPDGLVGPATRGVIGALRAEAGIEGGPEFDPFALGNVLVALKARFANAPPHRLLPFTLPSDLIAQLNREAIAKEPGYPPLQVMPTLPPVTPAGQVAAVAGYGRPASVAMRNSVGANPGMGYLTDPRGLHTGLWEQLEGRWHAPLGTGQSSADVDMNPLAGQPGGYFAAWRLGRY